MKTVSDVCEQIAALPEAFPFSLRYLNYNKIPDFLCKVLEICDSIGVDPVDIVEKKMEINHLKYPVEECKKKADITKWTKLEQGKAVVIPKLVPKAAKRGCSAAVAFLRKLNHLNKRVKEFSEARDWLRGYTDSRLSLAIIAEVGELAEVFQWAEPTAKTNKLDQDTLSDACMEVADILLYVIHICRVVEMPVRHLWIHVGRISSPVSVYMDSTSIADPAEFENEFGHGLLPDQDLAPNDVFDVERWFVFLREPCEY